MSHMSQPNMLPPLYGATFHGNALCRKALISRFSIRIRSQDAVSAMGSVLSGSNYDHNYSDPVYAPAAKYPRNTGSSHLQVPGKKPRKKRRGSKPSPGQLPQSWLLAESSARQMQPSARQTPHPKPKPEIYHPYSDDCYDSRCEPVAVECQVERYCGFSGYSDDYRDHYGYDLGAAERRRGPRHSHGRSKRKEEPDTSRHRRPARARLANRAR